MPNATLAVDSSANAGSLTRSTGAVTVAGAIVVTGSAANNTTDSFTGGFTLQGGEASIAVTPGTGQTSTLSLGAFNRSGNGTLLFSGPNLGAAAGSNVAQIKFSSVITPFANAVAGNNTAVTILPWAVGDTTPGGTAAGFVTYDANGVRLLNPSEYATTPTANQNVQLSASTSVTGPLTLQSLSHNPNGGAPINLSGTGALTISQTTASFTGGAILNVGGNGANANTISIPTLNFANEAVFDTVNDLTLTSVLTGNQAFTKTGPGTLTLGGSTVLSTTGAVTVNNGTLKLGAANSLNAAPPDRPR